MVSYGASPAHNGVPAGLSATRTQLIAAPAPEPAPPAYAVTVREIPGPAAGDRSLVIVTADGRKALVAGFGRVLLSPRHCMSS